MWLGADMAAVGELVLVLGLLVSAHCEVRARDPGVEEEEEEFGGRLSGGGEGGEGGGAFPTHLEGLPPGATEAPPARMGNWCSFVQKRVVTTAVACGTEKYTIRSQSPCPSGMPDCQMVMYKLSNRPLYRQKQQIVTALLWRCCPGYGGENCEEADADVHLESGVSALITGPETVRTELKTEDVQMKQKMKQQLQRADPNREQNDHQVPASSPYDIGYTENRHNATHYALNPGPTQKSRPTPQQAANTYPYHPHHRHHQQGHGEAAPLPYPSVPLSYPDAPAPLPVPHMMALVMSQLQPLLEGFNRSLEHLSQQVGDLARDVAQLKSSQLQAQLQAEPPDIQEIDEAVEERLNTRLDETLQQVMEVRRQMVSHRADMEKRLHSQHTMLHYNLTSFKTDIDMKLKRHQKMLQVSLQAMNTTLAELKLDQDQMKDQLLDQLEDKVEYTPGDHVVPPSLPPLHPPSDHSALWEAIERLDNMVVNNTVKVGGLMEDLEVTSGSVQQLRRDFKELGKQINHTARVSQIQFMETGLEVEAARETVLRRVGELAGNLSTQGVRLQELDVDVDYLYTNYLYKQNSSSDCDCRSLKVALARLEKEVTNVTVLANENRMALDEDSEGGAGQWGLERDWEPAVGEIQKSLQQVKESLRADQTRTNTLEQEVNKLSSSLAVGLVDISGLKGTNVKLAGDMKHLSSSFNSLLKDAIRHSDVLELLLGEEVLEFLEWPVQDQEASSIPSLKEQLSFLQEQLMGHNLSITSLLGNRPEDIEEVPSADQPPSSSHLLSEDWPTGNTRRSSSGVPTRERQLLHIPDGMRSMHRGDGSDLWNLEKTVEELGRKVILLEEKNRNISTQREAPPGDVEAKLQAEVMWMKRGLEDHLRVFKNIFSNTDMLVGSDATLELDKLWQLVKNRDGKKEKKRGGRKKGSGGGGNHRRRRELSGPVSNSQSDDSLLLVPGSPLSLSNGIIVSQGPLIQGQFNSDTSVYTVPSNGTYLFIVTLNLRPGPANVLLRRGVGGPKVYLHQQEITEAGLVTGVSLLRLTEGEKVRLELRERSWEESEDNVFTVLRL